MHALSHSTGLYVHVLVEIMENLQAGIIFVHNHATDKLQAEALREFLVYVCILAWGLWLCVIYVVKLAK